jgi:SAM-dependent methyltransferase
VEERFAGQYADFESWHWWFRGRRRILEHVLRAEMDLSGAGDAAGTGPRVATVGCGPPAALGWLVRAAGPGALVVGLDADVSGALRRGDPGETRAVAEGAAFVLGRVEAPPLRAASCDAVLALDVLEHIDDDAAALAAAARLLRPGGTLLVTVPALPWLWGSQDVVSHHKRRYTARSLCRAFSRAGLRPAWHSYFNTALLPVIGFVRVARRLLGRVDAERSDFEQGRPGLVNEILARVFALERHVVGRVRLPVGVSLLAVARAPEANPGGGEAAS